MDREYGGLRRPSDPWARRGLFAGVGIDRCSTCLLPAGWMTRLTQRAAAFLVAAFLSLALVVDRSASILAFVMLFGGLVVLFVPPARRSIPIGRDEKLLLFAFVLFFGVAAVSFLHRGWSLPGISMVERYARFLMVIPVFYLVRYAAPRSLVVFGAIGVGVLLAGGVAAVEFLRFDGEGRLLVAGGPGHHILFGCGSVLFAFLGLASAGALGVKNRGLILVSIGLLALGLLAAVTSGSRGAWAAVPALLLLVSISPAPLFPKTLRVGLLCGCLALATLAYALPQTGVASRMAEAVENVREYREEDGRRTTSLGARFEMWRAAAILIAERPVLGVGVGGYAEAIEPLFDEHGIDPIAARWNNPHSEYLSVLSTRGLVGLVALLLLLGIPATLFGRAWRDSNPMVQAFGFAGLVVVVSYAVFGISESIFERTFPITLYSVLTASLFAMVRLEEARVRERLGEKQRSLSVIIITLNEADRLEACIRSVEGVADEIVVLDSGSTDGTVGIARRLADLVEVTDWPGYGRQKQRALERATGDWVLSIDADERVCDELYSEIDAVLRDSSLPYAAFRAPIATVLHGRCLDFGRSGPRSVRLFRREGARFDEAAVHESVVPPSGPVGRLRGRLEHRTHRSYEHGAQKMLGYASIKADEKSAAGARGGVVWGVTKALFEFLVGYVLRLGFLDGRRGLLMAVLQAQYVFNTQAGIWVRRLEKEATSACDEPKRVTGSVDESSPRAVSDADEEPEAHSG